MHILRDTENASLAFKIIVEKNNKHMKKIKHSESPIERRQLLPKAMATLLSACKKEQWGITDAIKSQQRTTF